MLAIVTAVYASIIALLLIALSLNVVKIRRAEGVGLSHGDNEQLKQAMRLQANLVEYAPIALLLLLFLELNQASHALLHAFGILFVIARILHIWGFGTSTGYSHGRFFGTLTTMMLIIAMALANVFLLLTTV